MNRGFDILRSSEGIDFETIGWQQGNGTCSNAHDYSFKDFDVEKNTPYYYRLQQVDFSGKFELSEIVMATLTGQGFSMVAMPNPFHNARSHFCK